LVWESSTIITYQPLSFLLLFSAVNFLYRDFIWYSSHAEFTEEDGTTFSKVPQPEVSGKLMLF
jgi:hypothetical protein